MTRFGLSLEISLLFRTEHNIEITKKYASVMIIKYVQYICIIFVYIYNTLLYIKRTTLGCTKQAQRCLLLSVLRVNTRA